MGTMTFQIAAITGPYFTIVSEIETNCYTEKRVTVNSGTNTATYHVYVQSSEDAIPQMSINETLTSTNKTYSLILNGSNESGGTLRSNVIMVIRDTDATGEVLATVSIRREHSEDIC